MRLDKFLKLTRLVKRRPVANTLCDAGRVSLDGKVAKASTTVSAGQLVELHFGNRYIKAKILGLPNKALGNQEEAAEFVQIITSQRLEDPKL